VKDALFLADTERWGFVSMKRATANIFFAGFAQLDAAAHGFSY